MASTTNIKFQSELEALLADNTAKEISAADVRTIVTSNYQPQMAWSGLLYEIQSGSNSGEFFCRTNYYNPAYFNDFAGFVLSDSGAGLQPNHTYTDLVLTPPTSYGGRTLTGFESTMPATFDVTTTSTGIVESFVLKTPGAGWVSSSSFEGGMLGTFNIPGASTQPTLRFNGPVYIPATASGSKFVINMRSSISGPPNFYAANTIVNMSNSMPITASNTINTGAYFTNYDTLFLVTDGRDMSITLWRVAQ